MGDITTTGEVASGITEFYDRTLIKRALPYLPHALFGQMRPLPSRTADKIKFRKYNSLSKALVSLQEGITPPAQQLSITDIEATPEQYGSYVVLSDKVQFAQPDAVLTETTELCGENMAETIDTIYREVLNAGTNVYYAGGVATRLLTATNIVEADVHACVTTLRKAKAKYFTKMIKGESRYNTYPVAESYWGITSPQIAHDLELLTNFKRVEEYSGHMDIQMNEFGSLGNVRFIWSNEAKWWDGLGAASADVGSTLIFGRDAYGLVPIQGQASEVIIKAQGSGGTSDPLNQRGTVGWIANTTAKILTQGFMVRLETLSSQTWS